MQLDFEKVLVQEKTRNERKLPYYLQTDSAPLVRYTGESKTGLPNGAIGFICGARKGKVVFKWRSNSCDVSLLDLEPMKVTSFTDEEKNMEYPKPFERVEIISNETMSIVDAGYLTVLAVEEIVISDKTEEGRFVNERNYDAKLHHFNGYKPSKLWILKEA